MVSNSIYALHALKCHKCLLFAKKILSVAQMSSVDGAAFPSIINLNVGAASLVAVDVVDAIGVGVTGGDVMHLHHRLDSLSLLSLWLLSMMSLSLSSSHQLDDPNLPSFANYRCPQPCPPVPN